MGNQKNCLERLGPDQDVLNPVWSRWLATGLAWVVWKSLKIFLISKERIARRNTQKKFHYTTEEIFQAFLLTQLEFSLNLRLLNSSQSQVCETWWVRNREIHIFRILNFFLKIFELLNPSNLFERPGNLLNNFPKIYMIFLLQISKTFKLM